VAAHDIPSERDPGPSHAKASAQRMNDRDMRYHRTSWILRLPRLRRPAGSNASSFAGRSS